GTKTYRLGLVSQAYFICNIICTGILSRCWRSPPTEKQEEQRTHEISDHTGGQHGDLHRQKQAAAAPGVAEEPGRYRGPEESFSHRSRADPVCSGGTQAASDDQQALSAGHDAGAAARVQPD